MSSNQCSQNMQLAPLHVITMRGGLHTRPFRWTLMSLPPTVPFHDVLIDCFPHGVNLFCKLLIALWCERLSDDNSYFNPNYYLDIIQDDLS